MLLFDIVFKSGEFYGDEGSFIQDFIISVVGAGIGAYVTFRVFRETLKADRKKENRARAEEKEKEAKQRAEEQEKELKAKNDLENERLLYLHHLVSNSIEFTKFFQESLNIFYFEFEKDEMSLPQLGRAVSNDLQRITYNIDREAHFHAYRIHVKKTGILEFYSVLDYIEQVRIQVFDILGKADALELERKIKFRDKVEELTDLCQVYLQNYDLGKINKVEERNIVNGQLAIKIKIIESNPFEFQGIAEYFARPIAKYYVDNDIKKLSPDFIQMAILAGKIINLPDEIKSSNRIVAERLREYADIISSELDSLKKEFQALDEYCNQMFPNKS